jgi:hypothetical protein
MSDKYSNGLQWENLALKLIDLFSALSGVTGSLPGTWLPMLPGAGTPRVASAAWQKIEAEYRERVHRATRALIKTARLPDTAPEIVYFLGLRLLIVIDHVEAMVALEDQRPVSLLTFPALPPDELIEWLLTDWADDHAIMAVFPVEEAPCARRPSASSLLAPSLN